MMIVKSSEAKPIWWMTQLVFLWISPDHQIDFLLVLWSQTNRTEPFSRSQFSTERRNSSSSENIESRLSKFNLQKALQLQFWVSKGTMWFRNRGLFLGTPPTYITADRPDVHKCTLDTELRDGCRPLIPPLPHFRKIILQFFLQISCSKSPA